MKLRTLLFCIAAALSLTLCASAADIVDSGECGENVKWTLDSDGVLTISGAGAMDDWEYPDFASWFGKRGNIVTAVMNNGVTSIGDCAFFDCANLTSVTISASVTSIGDCAFSDCASLTSVMIPASVTSIGDSAFSSCAGLTSVTIPNSVTSIGSNAFRDCASLTSVTIPNSVTTIGWAAFRECKSLTSVTIPDSVTSIEWETFIDCANLTSVTIGNSVTYIGSSAFDDCANLTSVTIPDSVTEIGWYAFRDCASLTSITIPNSVTEIGNYAFYLCANLTNVTIGDSVSYIGWDAFSACASLTDVYYAGSATQWSEILISDYRNGNDALKNATIHYNAKDIGVGITLTDENGETVGGNGQTEETKKDAFQDGAEFTASFGAVDPDASSGLVAASVFIIFYDKDGLMVSLESTEIDLSDPFNLMFVLDLRIPEGAKTLKILMLGDHLEPLRAARMIESSAA